MSFSFFGAPAPKKTAAPKKAAATKNVAPVKSAPSVAPVSADAAERRALAAKAGVPSYGTPLPTPPAPTVDNGTGQVDYGAQTVDNPAPMEPDLSEDALRKSPEYIARERALQAMLDEFAVRQGTEKTRYEDSYGKSLAELGYDPTNARFDMGEKLTSGERATTSGKAYNALRNDFAARGMLQSGAYQAQQGVLRDQLMKQREAIDTSRTRFFEDQNTALLGQQAQAEQQRKAALDAARQSILNSMGA